MEGDYKTYLAAKILSEGRLITYRLTSRALGVNANRAKEMLYDFHRLQNGRKPGTTHATYLIAGYMKKELDVAQDPKDGDDAYMQSSPVLHSEELIEDLPILAIKLVKEEDLEKLRSDYEVITSIHIYSIGPHPIKDAQMLSDVTREITETSAEQDPCKLARTYGIILNPGARRRTGWRPLVSVPSAKATTSRPKDPEVKSDRHDISTTSSQGKKEPITSQSAAARDFFAKGPAEKKTPKNPIQQNRGSSDIFKSFAKVKPKMNREDSDSSVGVAVINTAAPSVGEDQPMKDASEDEEDDYIVPTVSNEPGDSERKSRKEREAGLRKMMDESDDNEPEPATDDIDDAHTKEISIPPPEEEPTTSNNGRRRGRRRVMKKKTVKDGEGYLVTREEPAWESFSEDETVVTNAKSSSLSASSAGRAKKPTAKGQGSIMSFFGKK